MDDTTQTKGAPATERPQTPRLEYIKAEVIRLINSDEFLDAILMLVILFDGIMIGRAI